MHAKPQEALDGFGNMYINYIKDIFSLTVELGNKTTHTTRRYIKV